MKQVFRDGALIDYSISGTGDKTILFVHGSYIDQTYWKAQVDYFSNHYRVVTMDLPGHGKSGRERKKWTITGFAEDVATLIRELTLKNVILVGHSLGADICMITATSYPANIIGFVAVDYFKMAGLPLPPEYQEQVKTIIENLKKDFAGTNEQYAKMALLTARTDKAIAQRIVKDYRNAHEAMGNQITPEVFKMYEIQQQRLPQLQFKLYLLNVDYIPTDEKALQKITGAGYELISLKGSSHYPMIEDPMQFNGALEDVLQKIK